MIKISVLYPNTEGSRFDLEYYCGKHMPMLQQMFGDACKGVAVDAGLAGPEPGSRAPYVAIGHLLFDSVEALQTAFGTHMQAIIQDMPNYTDIQPITQISAVKM